MFLLFFIELERHESFAYLPKKLGSKSSSSLLKKRVMSWVNFKVRKWLWEGKKPRRHRRI